MARQRSMFDDEGHHESSAEYNRRMQDTMDSDSWQGVDTLGARRHPPERAIIHDIEPSDERHPPHIYNWGHRKDGY